jgi:hypothetical protein|uniref:Uncharacterized protein n=1 Tax=viral metagenome TaxID=1070528 RepID=A0A6C0CW18_9ZZZZ
MNTPTKKTPTKKRSELDYTTSEDGYDTDATVIASPYNVNEQSELERQYKRQQFDRQNEEYERNQLLPDFVPPTIILDRRTNKPFYIKNSEGILETVTSANVRNGNNTFYNIYGEQINREFLDFTGELGGKVRRKTRCLRKKLRKSRRKNKKSKKSRKYK